jgi:hypothetical protein
MVGERAISPLVISYKLNNHLGLPPKAFGAKMQPSSPNSHLKWQKTSFF